MFRQRMNLSSEPSFFHQSSLRNIRHPCLCCNPLHILFRIRRSAPQCSQRYSQRRGLYHSLRRRRPHNRHHIPPDSRHFFLSRSCRLPPTRIRQSFPRYSLLHIRLNNRPRSHLHSRKILRIGKTLRLFPSECPAPTSRLKFAFSFLSQMLTRFPIKFSATPLKDDIPLCLFVVLY